LIEKKYKEIFICVLISAILTATSLALMTGDFLDNLKGFLMCLGKYKETFIVGPDSLFASSDPYNGIRTINIFNGASIADAHIWSPSILKIYAPTTLIFACAYTLYIIFNRKIEYWEQVLVVCMIIMLFPNVANDYKLTMLLPGLFLLLNQSKKEERHLFILTLICLLMIPKSYFFYQNIGITNILNPIILLIIAIALPLQRRHRKHGTCPQ
jgi:hypothetical protein